MTQGGEITFKTGLEHDTRGFFQLNGVLDNQTDTQLRSISPKYPIFAISRDLGTIQVTQDPVIWAIGFTTDPAIQYTDPSVNTPQQRSLFYKTQYPDDSTLVSGYISRGMMRLTSYLRSLISSMISLMPCQELSNWTQKYSGMRLPSRKSLEIWCPSQPHKYTAAFS